MKRGVLIVLGLLVLTGIVLLVVGAIRSKPAATAAPNLTIWSPFDEEKVYRSVSAPFMKANPNATVTFKYIEAKDAKDYEAKVVNAIADGNGPDIWLVRSDWLPKHTDKSLAAISDDQSVNPVEIAKSRIMPKIVDMNTVNGQLYGIPLAADALAIIYNEDFYVRYLPEANEAQKAALGRLAKTWDDLKLQVEGISRSSGNTVSRSAIALGTSDNTFAASDVIGAFLAQRGTKVLSDDQKNVVLNLATYKNNQPLFPATDALAYYTVFAKPGSAAYSWNSGLGDPIDAFMNQRTGALLGYYSTLQTIINKKPNFKLKIAPLVQPSLDVERVDYGVSWSHIVNKNSSNGLLAWNYLGTLISDDIQSGYADATGRISVSRPASQLLLEDRLVGPEQARNLFRIELQYLHQLTKPEWQGVDEILQDMIKQVVTLGQTPQNSADSAAERLKAYVTP